MPGSRVVCLTAWRRARGRAEAVEPGRRPLVITFDQDAVSLIVGAGDDEIEIALSFEQAEELIGDIRRGIDASRTAGRDAVPRDGA